MWQTIGRVLGEAPQTSDMRRRLRELEESSSRREGELASQKAALEQELAQLREERLRWMAKESGTRKELQECQERAKELLEQVVRLTHQQQLTKQSLIDQQFKTSTTPLERNRFEMELSEARAKVKEAEERVRKAEERAARVGELEKQLARLKQVESELAWARQQSELQKRALGAAIERVRELEEHPPRPRAKAPAAPLRPWKKPALKPASGAQRAFFSAGPRA